MIMMSPRENDLYTIKTIGTTFTCYENVFMQTKYVYLRIVFCVLEVTYNEIFTRLSKKSYIFS